MRSSVLVTSALVLAVAAQFDLPGGSACEKECKPVVSACNINTSDPSSTNPSDLLNCICSDSNWKNVVSCFQCAANQIGDPSGLQTTVNQISQACSSSGHSVSSATITGGGGGASPTASGSSPSGTSGGSGSGSGGNGAAVGMASVPKALLGAVLAGLGAVLTL